jgi:hypothetical protein
MTVGRIGGLRNGRELFSVSKSGSDADNLKFWRDGALPFIEARSVREGRKVCYARPFRVGDRLRGHLRFPGPLSHALAPPIRALRRELP